ncbi:MAG: hypothetical protein L0229_04895 [Blastocatellia bacterium]|nr:hypothetical protein [Blastocatellia bacterium]
MFKLTGKQNVKAIIVVLFVAAIAYGFSSGPPSGHTGAPGDNGTCVVCHAPSAGSGPGSGSIRIENVPQEYTLGQQYTINVVIQEPGRQVFGFQMTAIDDSGNRAGTFASLDSNTRLNFSTGSGGRQYIQHTLAGTQSPVTGSRTWQVRWTAPSSNVGRIRFFVAGNAANDDGTNGGDIIHTFNAVSNQGVVACSFSIAPAEEVFSGEGGNGSLEVTTQSNCDWVAISNDEWISITQGGAGTGNRTVSYTVAANPNAEIRRGTLTVAGQTFTVVQAGTGTTLANLTVTNTGPSESVSAASRITYTITVNNSGPDMAADVVANATTPQGTTFDSITATVVAGAGAPRAAASNQGTSAAPPIGGTGDIIHSLGDIPPGGTATIKLTLNVIAATGATISNTVSVTSASVDLDTEDNSAEANTTVEGGGIVELSWEQPSSTQENPTPSPTNIRVNPAALTSTGNAPPPADQTCTLLMYRVYISDQQPVQLITENLRMSLPPNSLKANAPVSPDGSFYVITAVWQCGETEIESGSSGVVNVPGGPRLNNVKVGGKIKIKGTGFTGSVEVFLEGIGFSKNAKVKKNNTQIIQKGNLMDGRRVSELIDSSQDALLTVRNSDGGISSVKLSKQ